MTVTSIEELFSGPSRGPSGNPIKGARQTIIMHSLHEGWKCTVQYWFVARWNEANDPDPATCLRKALAMEPDLTPLPTAGLPASLRAGIAERCGEAPDANDIGDLLV